MSLREKQSLFAINLARLIIFTYEKGFELSLGEAWRTPEQQRIYLRRGLTKTSHSRHMDRLAIDLNLFKNGKYLTATSDYQELGDYWKTLHPDNRWGGDFTSLSDGNHFEMKP